MPLLSLHAHRYAEADVSRSLPDHADGQDRGSIFLDIAGVSPEDNDNRFKVQCWPGDEVTGRVWGMVGKEHAAILPFRMKATQSIGYNINNFEVELILRTVEDIDDWELVSSAQGNAEPVDSVGDVYLLDIPRPEWISAKDCVGSHAGDANSTEKVWYFGSEAVTGHDQRARAAKWTWNANGHDPRVLHAAMAIGHSNQCFRVECHTRGLASKSLRKYRFNNTGHQNNEIRIHPQEPNIDLDMRSRIVRLEKHMIALNSGSATTLSSTEQVEEIPPTVPVNLLRGHRFDTSMFSGASRVHQGDVYNYNYATSSSNRPS